MKKVLFINAHPAPYMDIIYNDVSYKYALSVIYLRSRDKSKQWKDMNNYPGVLASELGMMQLFRKIRDTDLVVIGGWTTLFERKVISLCLFMNKKIILHTDVPNEERINSIKRLIKKIFFKLSSGIFVTGKTGLDHFEKHYDIPTDRMWVFPYGIENVVLDSNDTLDISSDIKLKKVFIANRFIARKGYDVLFDALVMLDRNGGLKSFVFNIAGSGPLLESYKEKFKKLNCDVVFLGWIENDEYKKHMETCDVYIHTSKFEPYGIPIIDALKNGKLVIASDGVMSAIDTIVNNVNGFIYNKDSCLELAEIMTSISKNNPNHRGIREQASKIKGFEPGTHSIIIGKVLD